MTPVDRDRLPALAVQSVETILSNQAVSGAYPAAPSFEPYRFRWLRDGSFIADASAAHGGVHRNAEVTYYGGGEWLLLAARLGWCYAAAGRMEEAWAELAWVADRAEANGDLPEQSGEHLLAPAAREWWLHHWGPPASPLLWSHAFCLALAIRLGLPVRESVAA